MNTLAAVAGGLTLGRVAVLAREAVRLDAVKLREGSSTALRSAQNGAAVGRPEYLSLKNALRKEALYLRWQDGTARSRRLAEAGWRRWLENEEKKRARVEAWLAFDPEEVPVSWDYAPDF